MRLLILVEGPTEQAFVSRCLAPYLATEAQIVASAPCIETSRDRASGRSFRGGHAGRYALIRKHIDLLLRTDRGAQVTTLLDLYGLPPDFPGLAEQRGRSGTGAQRAVELEAAFATDIADRRFLPNLVVHEFEGLLFAAPEILAAHLPRPALLPELARIAAAHASPEDINDSPQTAPSKRLEQLCPGYGKQKPRLGPLIADQIGVPRLREKCPHFDGWVQRVLALPGVAAAL